MLEGGEKLENYLTDLAERMRDGEVSVGFFDTATYPDGTKVAAVAFFNEFGRPSRGQPPRPFFRRMIAKESPTWAGKLQKAIKFTKYDSERALHLMGEDIQGALIKSINDLTSPPLAPSTIAAKGFSKPLIDSSHMVNSTGYEVEMS